METWVASSMFQLGPIGDENRGLRIEFWPDANNNVPRAVEQMLARDDALTADTLARQSVAAQGLPALERLLFDRTRRPSRSSPAASARHGAARTRARSPATWSASHARSRPAGPRRTATRASSRRRTRGSDVFATRGAAIDEVVNALVTALSASRDDRLSSPLGGDTAADAKPFRRSRSRPATRSRTSRRPCAARGDLRRRRGLRLRRLPACEQPRRAGVADRRGIRDAARAGRRRPRARGCRAGRGPASARRRSARSRDRTHRSDRG